MPKLHDANAVLYEMKLKGVTLTNTTGCGVPRTIGWTQVARSLWGCEEKYRECVYKAPDNREFAVFVAEEHGAPPDSFNTNGVRGKLHMGILNLETSGGETAIFFVIHPKDWYPFQHRFKTEGLTKLILKAGGKAADKCAPGAGSLVPSLLGDYLHFLG